MALPAYSGCMWHRLQMGNSALRGLESRNGLQKIVPGIDGVICFHVHRWNHITASCHSFPSVFLCPLFLLFLFLFYFLHISLSPLIPEQGRVLLPLLLHSYPLRLHFLLVAHILLSSSSGFSFSLIPSSSSRFLLSVFRLNASSLIKF